MTTHTRAALAVAALLLLVAGSAVAATPPPTPDPALVALPWSPASPTRPGGRSP